MSRPFGPGESDEQFGGRAFLARSLERGPRLRERGARTQPSGDGAMRRRSSVCCIYNVLGALFVRDVRHEMPHPFASRSDARERPSTFRAR